MSERQFRALHPVEVLRIPPAELTTARLGSAMRWLARFRDFEAARRFLEEYLRRKDREKGDARNDLLAEVIGAAGNSRDADALERFARHIADAFGDPAATRKAASILQGSRRA